MGELRVFHLNVGRTGLQRSLTELGLALKEQDPDIVCLNETKLRGVLTWPLLWSNQFGTWVAGGRAREAG